MDDAAPRHVCECSRCRSARHWLEKFEIAQRYLQAAPSTRDLQQRALAVAAQIDDLRKELRDHEQSSGQ